MTTSLPEIRIRPTDSGHWLGQCMCCGWSIYQINRPVVDLEAIEHRRRCRRKD